MSQYPITITGRLTHEPELSKISENMYKTRFRIASSRSVAEPKEGGGILWRELDLNFIDAEVWGQCAINVKRSLRKGMPILVTGPLVTDRWEDQHGAKRSRSYIKASHVGLDLNRFVVVTSTKVPAVYSEDGGEPLWLGENPPVPDYDYTVPTGQPDAGTGQPAEPAPDEEMPEALQPGAGDSPHDTAADRQQALNGAAAEQEEQREPEEVMA